jgi:alcohol dehydrogenase, propanol-preferring
VINAIRKEPNDQEALLQTDFARHLWMEKEVKSVANVTRKDAEECLALAEKAGIRPVVQEYALDEANEALADLRSGRIRGSKVLVMPE